MLLFLLPVIILTSGFSILPIVIKDKKEGFSKDLCRSIMAVRDWDRSEKLSYEQFKALWTDIIKWKRVFALYDKDGSEIMSAFNLRQALNSCGYRLKNHTLNKIAHRYSNRQGMITFDDFLTYAVRLKAMIDTFLERDPQRRNFATFSVEEWPDN